MPKQARLYKADEADIRTAYTEGVSKVYLRLHYHISEPRLRGILGDLFVHRRLRRAAMKRMGTRPQAYGIEAAPEGATEQPPVYTPQEYFQAIADGLRERNADNNALNADNNALRADNSTLGQELVRLEAANRQLLSDLNQCKLQMANWSGPIRLPGRSLGNGG